MLVRRTAQRKHNPIAKVEPNIIEERRRQKEAAHEHPAIIDKNVLDEPVRFVRHFRFNKQPKTDLSQLTKSLTRTLRSTH